MSLRSKNQYFNIAQIKVELKDVIFRFRGEWFKTFEHPNPKGRDCCLDDWVDWWIDLDLRDLDPFNMFYCLIGEATSLCKIQIEKSFALFGLWIFPSSWHNLVLWVLPWLRERSFTNTTAAQEAQVLIGVLEGSSSNGAFSFSLWLL